VHCMERGPHIALALLLVAPIVRAHVAVSTCPRPGRFVRCTSLRAAADGLGGSGNSLGDEAMATLLERMRQARANEESQQVADMVAAANNWRTGQCQQQTVAVLDAWVRRAHRCDDLIAVGTYTGDVHLIEASSGETRRVWRGTEVAEEITALCFDGEHLSHCDADGDVSFRRLSSDSEEPLFSASHRRAASGVHWDGGQLAYSCSLDGRLVCYNIDARGEVASLSFRAPVLSMSVFDGYVACSLRDGAVALCSLSPLRELIRFDAHPGSAATAVHLVTSNQLITGSADGEVLLWRLEEEESSGRRRIAFEGHNGPVVCVQGDCSKVVSGARDGTVRVWEADTGQLRFTLQGYTAYLGSVQIAPTWLMADGTNNVVTLLDFGEQDDEVAQY